MGNSTRHNTPLPLFEEDEIKTSDRIRGFFQGYATCHFCGEQMPRGIMSFNHGIVFNGWCMKALALHTRNGKKSYTEEARWLESKGIDPKCDRYDESVWRHDIKEQHFDNHFSSCYRSEECK